tara:strand:+ start:4189 stop:4371 length:183 start_codon:yes stop_codon:yes gene_type:complete
MEKDTNLDAYNKGVKIVRSCISIQQLTTAYNWIWLYKKKYGQTRHWEGLLSYCSKRRNAL